MPDPTPAAFDPDAPPAGGAGPLGRVIDAVEA